MKGLIYRSPCPLTAVESHTLFLRFFSYCWLAFAICILWSFSHKMQLFSKLFMDSRQMCTCACNRLWKCRCLHASTHSSVANKLGLVKGFTQKLHRPKPFDLWILPSEYRPPPLVFQGKPLKTHQNMAVKLEALLLLLFSRFYFYLAWALVDPLLVHSESFASRGLILVNQCQSIVDHVMT